MIVVLKPTDDPKDDVQFTVEPHTFKSGTVGWYFRDRVVLNGVSHHTQITISRKP